MVYRSYRSCNYYRDYVLNKDCDCGLMFLFESIEMVFLFEFTFGMSSRSLCSFGTYSFASFDSFSSCWRGISSSPSPSAFTDNLNRLVGVNGSGDGLC